jgi:tRNA threonylcarbamoyladenosine biosynthesis protein TsaE
MTLKIDLESPAATKELAQKLVSAAGLHVLVLLKGPLGAGKTTFAQGVGQVLGITEAINSPTFTTLNEYHSGTAPLYHFDLYRLHDGTEVETATGLRFIEEELEELQQGPCVILIEWPEVLNDRLQSRDYVCVELNYSDLLHDNQGGEDLSGRSATISANGSSATRVIGKLANVYFS